MPTRVSLSLAFVLAGLAGAADAGQTNSPVLVDRDLTVAAGAAISTTLGEAVAKAEDEIVPSRLFAERGALRRSANVSYRFLKYLFFDAPQEELLLVTTHEVFGHGARLRELFDGRIGYRIKAPVPYGEGGGSTSFTFDRPPGAHELLAVSVAGMEADAVGASLIAHRSFLLQRTHPRDALRYLLFEFDTLSYIWSTDDEGERPGHDVDDFLETYNEVAAALGARGLTARTLRREAFIGLANPMVVSAAVALGRYIWNGAADGAVPSLSIGGMRYLPMVRYRLTPFGTEWAVVNELNGGTRPTRIEVRIGRAPDATPWGVGLRRDVTTWREWRVEGALDVWRQPRLTGGAFDPLSRDTHVGAQVRGRVERPLIPVWFAARPATVIVEAGVKTSGFVPGERLGGGVDVRGGVGLPLSR